MRPAETSTASLSSLADLAGLSTNAPAQVVTGPVASWGRAPVVTPDGVPLIVEGDYGAGRVVELAFDPLGEPFDAQVDLAGMSWSQAISRGLSGARGGLSWSRLPVKGPPQLNALAGSGPGTWSPYPGYLDPVFNDFTVASMPPFGLLAVLLAAYGLLVSLLSYVLLKAMGRRGLLWATVPALAIACTGTAYAVGFGARGSDYQLTQLQVQRLGPGGVVETVSFGGVFSPRRGDVRVSPPPNTLASTAVALFSSPGTRGHESVISVGSRPEVLLNNVSVWDMRPVQTLSVTHPVTHEPGQALPIEAQLKMSHGRVVGQVTNRTSHTVRDLRLVSLPASQAELVATLPPGATAAVDAQLTQGASPVPFGKFGVPGPGPVTGPSSAENARQAAIAIATGASSSRPGELVLVGFTDPADTLQVEGRRPARRARAVVAEPVQLQSADSLSAITPSARLVSSLSATRSGPLDVYDLDLPPGLTGRVGLNLVALGIQPAVYSVGVYDWNLRSWRSVPVQVAPAPGLTPSTAPLTASETAQSVVRLRIRENAPVLLLDEPASGLDPRARVEMRELIRELQRMGKTILVSSHIVPEVEELCTWIGVIDRGRMTEVGPKDHVLRRAAAGRRLRIDLFEPDDVKLCATRQKIEERGDVGPVEVVDGGLEVAVRDGFPDHQLLRDLIQAGLDVRSFTPIAVSLSDVFMRLTGLDEGEQSA